MKTTLFISILMLSFGICAQSDTLNQKDSLGKKQGYWIIYGKDEPQKGYPDEGKIAEGAFIDDRKNGQWVYYHKDGVNPKAKSYFVNNRPNGPYEKYYLDGSLKEKGVLNKGRPRKLTAYWENGSIKRQAYFNERGQKHGKWLYYFENGEIETETKFRNGTNIDTTKLFYSSGDLKELIVYDSTGKEPVRFFKPQIIRDSTGKEIYRIVEPPADIKKPYGIPHQPIIKSNFEGIFKGGRPWEGIYYKYSGMMLRRVEVWKEGKYWAEAHTQYDSPIDYNKKRVNMDLKTLREYCSCSDTSQTKIDTRVNKWNPKGSEHQDRYDGIVCDDKFWCGWLCVYDRDGLLLKVKVYSNGKYIGDAQL